MSFTKFQHNLHKELITFKVYCEEGKEYYGRRIAKETGEYPSKDEMCYFEFSLENFYYWLKGQE